MEPVERFPAKLKHAVSRLLWLARASDPSFPRSAWERQHRRSASSAEATAVRDAERRPPFPRRAWERGCEAWVATSAVLACFLLSLPGCLLTESYLNLDSGKPTGDVAKVMAIWKPAVVSTPDPMHGGEPLNGLAGRVYLFGPDMSVPLVGDGTIVVELYSDMPGSGKEPLEGWRFEKDALKQLLKRDAAGWGYTLFLPWGTYRPDICRVHLRLRYERPKCLPIYANSEPMVLQKPGDGIVRTTSSQRVLVPTNGKLQ